MNELSSSYAPIRFEKIVAEIFTSCGFKITLAKNAPDNEFDILANLDDKKYLIEIQFSRTKLTPSCSLFGVASRLKALVNQRKYDECTNIPVLVTGAKLTSELREKIEGIGVIAIDIQNLLFLIQDNEYLKSELLSLLDFSVNDLLPESPKLLIPFPHSNGPSAQQPCIQHKNQGELLKERIRNWKNDNGNNAYEDLCFDVLKYLFNNELSLWRRQKTSNADLYRFDLICKIKDGDVSGLWSTILQCFNSKYIIFEFKNYRDKITQKEIYTTDKYLYLKALRSVAILISCEGTSTNADKAIRGTLRENGKVILSVSNQDLIKMINIKINNNIPADYLYSKFDELLISLEK